MQQRLTAGGKHVDDRLVGKALAIIDIGGKNCAV